MMMTLHDDPRARALSAGFRGLFERAPHLVTVAPGRVNLIGEHTDYSDGFVLPVALGLATRIALAPRDDGEINIAALDLRQFASFSIDSLGAPQSHSDWTKYPRGVVWAMQQAGVQCPGFDAAITSTVPTGAGLSSSAALELALARGLAELSGWAWDPEQAARTCQRAESEYVGVRCGLMDQLCSAAGRAGHALFIDCRSGAVDPQPLPESLAVVVLDTGTRRELGDSEFNARRQACESAAQQLGVPALRDIDDLPAALRQLPSSLHPYVRHGVEENARTVAMVEALGADDHARIGALLGQAHRSLRDDYRVSAPALDRMVELASSHPACIGARLTGAGFAGCVVALVEQEAAPDFARATVDRFGGDARAYVERAHEGARVL